MRSKRHCPLIPTVATIAGPLLLGGCASAAGTTAVGPAQTSVAQSSVAQSQDSTPDATSVQTASAVATAIGSVVVITPRPVPVSSSTPIPPAACRTSTLIIVDPPAGRPLAPACLHMGVDAQITLGATGGWVWSPVQASSPAVVAVTDAVESGHTHHVTVRPVHPGSVTLSSELSFTPDPHGPATQGWSLTLTIVP